MNTKIFSFFAVLLIAALNACSPVAVASPTEQQPTPASQPVTDTSGYQQVTVDAVEVEVGLGSPIPVHAIVSGNLPDTCSQVEQTEVRQDGSTFLITLLASPKVEGCQPDTLPFRMAIPLSPVDLPAGSYTVIANGARAGFTLDTGNTTSTLRPADAPIRMEDIQVDSIEVETGVGSPIPVHAIVSANLPSACAQLGVVRVHRDAATFFIRLIAYVPDEVACNPDSLPIRLEVPLNMVGLDPAEYTVNGNGTLTTFAWDPAAPAVPAGPFQLTYIGPDGNVWVHPGPGGQPEQITTDATGVPGFSDGSASVNYYFPQISSDGEWIAYRREAGTPVDSGLEFSYGLWVQHRKSGESQVVMEDLPAGFAWKPGTHLLAYGLGAEEGYFNFGGDSPIASLASGVMAFDADTGTEQELVKPERGYALYSLQWSPDGRYLGFDELVYIEGRGMFAYYDFETGEYVSWEEPIGNYAWDTNGSQVFYDRMVYTPTGAEDIYSRSLDAGSEQRLTDLTAETEYAFSPAISPRGDQIAYLTSLEGPDGQNYNLQVQDLAGGEPRTLGSYFAINRLSWSPDGSWLLFSAGPWENQQLYAVNISSGEASILGAGTMPDVAGD